MLNLWTSRAIRRKAVKEINRMLATYVGMPVSQLDKILQNMRWDVAEFFSKRPEYAKVFLLGNGFDYQFHILDKMGVIAQVTFEEKV